MIGLEDAFARIAAENGRIGALSDPIPPPERPLRQGPLSAMPIAVKDMIDTTPARCSSGLPFLTDYRPKRDAALVRRLRAAGAVIVGVAETDAGGFGARTSKVKNPAFPDRLVGGSSGGSAAAVLAGFAEAAIGTDTGGSVRIPAACCGLYGLKPTYGRISMEGVRPLAPSLDHAGVIARNLDSLMAVAAVLDPAMARGGADRGRSVAVSIELLEQATPPVRRATERAIEAFVKLGFTISLTLSLPRVAEITRLHWSVFCAEAALSHREFFATHLASYPSYAREPLEHGVVEAAGEYLDAKQRMSAIRREIDRWLRRHDLLLLPTMPIVTPLANAERALVGGRDMSVTRALIANTCLFNHTGHPALAVPVAEEGSAEPPASIQLIGRRNGDAALLGIARRLAEVLPPPRYED